MDRLETTKLSIQWYGFCFGNFVTKFVYVCAYKEKRPEGNTHTLKVGYLARRNWFCHIFSYGNTCIPFINRKELAAGSLSLLFCYYSCTTITHALRAQVHT